MHGHASRLGLPSQHGGPQRPLRPGQAPRARDPCPHRRRAQGPLAPRTGRRIPEADHALNTLLVWHLLEGAYRMTERELHRHLLAADIHDDYRCFGQLTCRQGRPRAWRLWRDPQATFRRVVRAPDGSSRSVRPACTAKGLPSYRRAPCPR
jgi:hypothetical protein